MPTRIGPQSEYYGQFPAKHRAVVIRAWIYALAWLIVIAPITALMAFLWLEDPDVVHWRMILMSCFLLLVAYATRPGRPQPRMIPYYPKHARASATGVDTICRGASLARHCKTLDEFCARQGVRCLSDFGFSDDLSGELVIWHDANAGIETCRTLRRLINESSVIIVDKDELVSDLSAIESVLESLRTIDGRFCFILRYGNTVSGVEMDNREGTFF